MSEVIPVSWVPNRGCPVCSGVGATERLGVRSERLVGCSRVLDMSLEDTLCLSCGFIYAAMRPDAVALEAYYRDAHTRFSQYVDVQPDYDVTRRLACIRRYVRPRGRVLELGAGTGEFCATLKDAGFTTVPVDPLGDDAWPHEKFDAVLAYLVLEHVYDPRDFIAEAVKRLGPEGVLIVEVPDFLRDPVASLVPEHLWHYAPQHLSALFADFDLATVEINRTDASRAFAFMIAARKSISAARPTFDADLIASMRAAYRRAATLAAAEESRTRALCDFVAGRKPPRVFVWGANEYATRIGKRLAEIGFLNVHLVDSAESKIGVMHHGFSNPVEPPVFSGNEPENSAVLLCSPAWNEQIRAQVETSALPKPWIIDAIKWESSVDTKANMYATPSLQ